MIKSLSIWWMLRRWVAERNNDNYVFHFHASRSAPTPWLLKLFGFRLTELIYHFSADQRKVRDRESMTVWLIHRKHNSYCKPSKVCVWRICDSGFDLSWKPVSPAICWERL